MTVSKHLSFAAVAKAVSRIIASASPFSCPRLPYLDYAAG